MTVVSISIASSAGSALLCAPGGEFGDEGLELDQSPTGLYSTAFTTRTVSGSFQVGGRVTGQTVPIRELVLPINCYEMPGQPIEKTISNLRKLWGSPLDRRKVTWTYTSELSGPRRLILQLASEIKFSPARDWNLDGYARAVVTAIAPQPMYESPEVVAVATNPGDRWIVTLTRGLLGGPTGEFTLGFGGQSTAALPVTATATAVRSALEALPGVGVGKVTVTGNAGGPWTVVFTGVAGTLTASGTGLTRGTIAVAGASIVYFPLANPTDQMLYPAWDFDPGRYQFPDFSFGQERRWKRPAGADAARMITTPPLTQRLSVMSDPMMDPYVNADLSAAAGDFNGVMPMYGVPPYTPETIVPVVCDAPPGAQVILTQRRFWSAESGLE